MPGGALSIVIDDQFQARMTGPVGKVATGTLAEEIWQGVTRTRDLGELSLTRFQPSYAATILSWISDGAEASAWAGVHEVPVDPSIFEQWHADPEVHPWMLVRDEEPVGYGEVWNGFEIDAVELARILIAPAHRGRGLGRILLDRLCETIPHAHARSAFLRVRPNNLPAIRCYEGAAFQRVSSEKEIHFNRGQPVDYQWMNRTIYNDFCPTAHFHFQNH
jgi:ribosomal protein S18 acetylase RimI-like enzyme